MGSGHLTDEEAIRQRTERALKEVPLSAAQIAKVTPKITTNVVRIFGPIRADSPFWDFKGKVDGVVERFRADGLTREAYLKAAIKQPSLFCLKPGTVIGNIERVVAQFAEEGLTLKGYLQATSKQPNLFTRKPETLQANIEAVVAHFSTEGLTIRDYLKAAIKLPSLFCLKPGTVIDNVRTVVDRFAGDGLTLKDYLKAAIKQPNLFGQRPATVIGNVEGVIDRFAEGGLTLKDYLRAATKRPNIFSRKPATVISNIEAVADQFAEDRLTLKGYLQAAIRQPALFTQKPATIIGHMHLLRSIFDRGLLPAPDDTEPNMHPAVRIVLAAPALLCLADSNLMLKTITAGINKPENLVPLHRTRSQLEAEVAALLGHEDLDLPVARVADTPSTRIEHANSLVLRGLIRCGVIGRGTLAE